MSFRKEGEEPLKAIVFADGCGTVHGQSLAPTDKLLNIPILSWQLSTLARYGVKEAIVLSSTPIKSPYEDPLGRMKVTPVSSPAWNGEGDAIREVESRDGMRPVDDFVLVQQGTVFNVDVTKLVAEHKRRKDLDRNWLITTAFRKGAFSASSGLVIALDTTTGTLLKYVEGMNQNGILLDVYAENASLQRGGAVEICSDVMDVGLDVCSPDFLLEFRENFYYEKVRAYIKEKLEGGEAEVFGNRMYTHFLNSSCGEYATRIHSLASFMQATTDALNGWLAPISTFNVQGKSREDKLHEYQGHFEVEKSVIGNDAAISYGSTILQSVIGNNVTIGTDVTVSRSILMDNVTIGDRCDIHGSILNASCAVEESTFIPKNCLLDIGVCIGPNFHDMCSHSLITLKDQGEFSSGDEAEDQDDEVEEGNDGVADSIGKPNGTAEGEEVTNWKSEHVGSGGKGLLIDLDVSMDLDPYFVPSVRTMHFESEEEDELEEEDDNEGEDDESDDSEQNVAVGDHGDLRDSGANNNRVVDGVTQDLADVSFNDARSANIDLRIAKFNEEVSETIERAYEEVVEMDHTALEINSLKLSYETSFVETQAGVIAGLARWALKSCAPDSLFAGVTSGLRTYAPIITRFSKDDETHYVALTEGLAKALGEHGLLVKYVLKAMYDEELLTDDAILEWAAQEDKRVQAGHGNGRLLSTLADLLVWLGD